MASRLSGCTMNSWKPSMPHLRHLGRRVAVEELRDAAGRRRQHLEARHEELVVRDHAGALTGSWPSAAFPLGLRLGRGHEAQEGLRAASTLFCAGGDVDRVGRRVFGRGMPGVISGNW
jgi:hypothetical protein